MIVDRIPLSRDRIVQSALGLAKHEGLAGVSMRKLAQELGVEAMSLYHHVPNKRALLILMADRSLASLRPADPSLPWTDRLINLLDDIFHAGVENPAMISVLASQELAPSELEISEHSALNLIESILRILDESGLPVGQRVHVYNSLVNLVYGFVLAKTQGMAMAPAKVAADDLQEVADERWGSFPALAAVLPDLTSASASDDLRFSLELYVGTLAQRAAASAGVSGS